MYVTHPVGFEITPESMADAWQQIHAACREHKCNRVLVEAVVPTREMTRVDAYRVGSMATSGPLGLRVALCFYGYKPDNVSEMFQLVTENRGAVIAFFENKEKALRWLRDEQE